MWNEAKWVCWFFPFCEAPRETCCSGTAPTFTATVQPSYCVTFSQKERTTSFGSRFCLFENILPMKAPLAARRHISAVCCGCFWLQSQGNLSICELAWPKPASLLLDWCAPHIESLNHPESSDQKQRLGPFSRRWSYVRLIFIFRLALADYPHKWEAV